MLQINLIISLVSKKRQLDYCACISNEYVPVYQQYSGRIKFALLNLRSYFHKKKNDSFGLSY